MIDTHVHTWNFSRAGYEWLKDHITILNRNYLLDELEAERKAAGITSGVLVQAANTIEETNYMLEVALEHDWIQGVVGWLPLINTDETEEILTAQYNHQPLIKGIRHLIHDEADATWLMQPAVSNSLQLLADYNLSYDVVGILETHLHCAIAIAEQIPSLKLVLDHMNRPPVDKNKNESNWFHLMEAAAAHANIFVKISGLGTIAQTGETISAEKIKPYIDFVLNTFGVDRCFCGGDWPVSLLNCSYTQTWKVYKEVLSSLLNENDLKKVYELNAAAFYKL